MRSLQDIRAGKPPFYPDQTIFAEYACSAFGLTFDEIAAGTGLVFTVGSPEKTIAFGAGRCSFFPQNTATAATLAADKYFTHIIAGHAGIATLGGQYFFLHDRHRADRPPGHERSDALRYLDTLGGQAFVKPLTGSRGDFAQAIGDALSLSRYLDAVARHHDAILMQPIVAGDEYRIFVLDDDIVYSARKTPPSIVGDGKRSIRALLAAHEDALRARGVSSAGAVSADDDGFDVVLPVGERRTIRGRMNRSAGGTMVLQSPPAEAAAFALARRAAKALGLRAAAVDIFTDIDGIADDMRIIEVNANPSIRFLEDCGRPDLILQIWRHTFSAAGLLGV